MNEIIATLSALSPHLNRRTLNQLTIVVEAVLAMMGRVTMPGLSRWAEKGGSYRTVQRFFWRKNRVAEVALATRQAASERGKGGLAADWRRGRGDQVGQGNAWAGRFFSSIYNKALPGLCFLNLSLLHVETRASYPLIVEQLAVDVRQVCSRDDVARLLSEQNIWFARRCTNYVYILSTGRVVFEGTWDDFDAAGDSVRRHLAV